MTMTQEEHYRCEVEERRELDSLVEVLGSGNAQISAHSGFLFALVQGVQEAGREAPRRTNRDC